VQYPVVSAQLTHRAPHGEQLPEFKYFPTEQDKQFEAESVQVKQF
jgi:hypothetical protein